MSLKQDEVAAEVRVRFAPSPTGNLHIGNIRTALFNYLFAKRNGGKFILRIEDTDTERSDQKYVDSIIADLSWLGLRWDEGPDTGGPYGPYVQSQRLDTYREHAARLLEAGKAYHCYCTAQELEQRRTDALKKGTPPRYDNRCRSLADREKAERTQQGIKPSVRLIVEPKTIQLDELIMGTVRFDTSLLGDFVIMKGSNVPTYDFAVTLDDHFMNISHVIRGEGHLSNTQRHLLLYEALSFRPPVYAHMSMTHAPGGGKLSKREGAASVGEYRTAGYLPESVINYAALLGWSAPGGKELISMEEMILEFDLKDVSRSPSVFDQKKMDWLNGMYIRNADLDRITRLATGYLADAGFAQAGEGTSHEKIRDFVSSIRDHLTTLREVVDHAPVFMASKVEFTDEKALEALRKESSIEILKQVCRELETCLAVDDASFKAMMAKVQKRSGKKTHEVFMPVRAALTGKARGPELSHIASFLGTRGCLKRLKDAISFAEGKE